MKTLTGKQAAITVDIRTSSGDMETFFFYDSEVLGNIIQALYAAQTQDSLTR